MTARFLVDTSVLVADDFHLEGEFAFSTASLGELHFGAFVAKSVEQRAKRIHRLGAIEATISALPMDSNVSREWGRLAALVATRGGRPRRRTVDLIIAATANVHRLPLVAHDVADFAIIEDQIELIAA